MAVSLSFSAAIRSASVEYLGGFDGFLYALVVFVVMDYFTGILAAGVKNELSGEGVFKEIAKKVCIFVLVGVANIVDTQVLHDGAVIRTAVIFFYLANEGLTILENCAIIGLPVPDQLKAALQQLVEKEHSKDDGNTENSKASYKLSCALLTPNMTSHIIETGGIQMSKWDKLLMRICSLSRDLRFDELRKVLESYGYKMNAPRSGSSHYTFRKSGCQPITIPKHEPIKKVYVELVRQVVESEARNDEDTE